MEPSRENDFRDDLRPRDQGGFNARDTKVQRQSIGWLDDSYFSSRIVLKPRYFSDTYTRIPPVSTLPNLWSGRGLAQNLLNKTSELFTLVGASLASIYAWAQSKTIHAKETVWTRMPKSYNLTRGAFIEWATFRRKALRILAPLLLLALLVLALKFLPGQTYEPVKPKTHAFSSGNPYMPNRRSTTSTSGNNSTNPSSSTNSQASPVTSSVNTDDSSVPGSSSSSSLPTSGAGASSSSPSSSSSLSNSSPSSSSAPASTSSTSSPSSSSSTSSGGTGGGSSSSSSLLPVSIATPAVNTSLGTKPLVVISPVTLTLN